MVKQRSLTTLLRRSQMLKRQGKVYTQVVENCSAKELLPIILGHAKTDSRIFSDGWKSYDGLVDFGYKKHYRVKHCKEEFASKTLDRQQAASPLKFKVKKCLALITILTELTANRLPVYRKLLGTLQGSFGKVQGYKKRTFFIAFKRM